MPIQFATYDLLIEDPKGRLGRFLNRFLAEEGMQMFGPPSALLNNRNNPRSGVNQFSGLPVPNYPEMPTPKINSLYWPTGASRWGYGLFLTDQGGLEGIISAIGSSSNGPNGRGNPGFLKLYDSDINPSSAGGVWMYMLPARRVSGFDGDGGNPLWILPLVDQRYWWQYLQCSAATSSWQAMLDSLGNTVGFPTGRTAPTPYYDAIAGAYGQPHAIEMYRPGESVAMMIDAAAHCLGKRFVLGLTNASGNNQQVGYLYGANSASTILNDNLRNGLLNGILAGGGVNDGDDIVGVPASAMVIFPNCDGSDVGDRKSAAIGGAVQGTIKTIFEAQSNCSSDSDWRQNLANQIAIDLELWAFNFYDITYRGIFRWNPCGYDNYVEWFVGRKLRGGQYQLQTRVVSMPTNFGVDNMCHQQNSSSSSSSGSSSKSSSSPSSSSPFCYRTIGNVPISAIPGYKDSTTQALIHDRVGCLSWIDIGTC